MRPSHVPRHKADAIKKARLPALNAMNGAPAQLRGVRTSLVWTAVMGLASPTPTTEATTDPTAKGARMLNEDAVEGAAATGDRGDRPQGSPLGRVVPQRVKQESAREQDARGKAEQDDPLPLKGTRC